MQRTSPSMLKLINKTTSLVLLVTVLKWKTLSQLQTRVENKTNTNVSNDTKAKSANLGTNLEAILLGGLMSIPSCSYQFFTPDQVFN